MKSLELVGAVVPIFPKIALDKHFFVTQAAVVGQCVACKAKTVAILLIANRVVIICVCPTVSSEVVSHVTSAKKACGESDQYKLEHGVIPECKSGYLTALKRLTKG